MALNLRARLKSLLGRASKSVAPVSGKGPYKPYFVEIQALQNERKKQGKRVTSEEIEAILDRHGAEGVERDAYLAPYRGK